MMWWKSNSETPSVQPPPQDDPLLKTTTTPAVPKQQLDEEENEDAVELLSENDDLEEQGGEEKDDEEDVNIFDEEFDGHAIRVLTWDDSSYFRVMIQVYGSVMPQLWPYCLFNAMITTLIWYVKNIRGIDITSHPSGHSYLALLLSFILAARARRALESYAMKASLFSRMYKLSHDVVDYTCFLTQNDKTNGAKQWRQDVCYSLMLFLRVVVAVLEYRNKTNPWLLPQMLEELEGDLWVDDVSPKDMYDPRASENLHPKSSKQKQKRKQQLQKRKRDHRQQHQDHNNNQGKSRPNLKDTKMGGALRKSLAHIPQGSRNPMDDMFRAPLLLAWNVRREILKQRDDTWFRNTVWEVQIAEEFRLLEFMDGIMKSYSDLYVMVSTPTPFPNYQLVETTLFVFVFTMPVALCHQTWDHYIGASLMIPLLLVFIITYGFLGISFVCAKMNDPFGDDDVSSFDCVGYTQMCMEDCYMTILQQDGKKWALDLRRRLRAKPKQA